MPDRVGFPENYSTKLTLLSSTVRDQEPAVISVYGNVVATSVTSEQALPYPDGAVIVMEWANALKDAAGAPVRDAGGQGAQGRGSAVDVMRRGENFGQIYGENRAGSWEFMSYRPDGSAFKSPAGFVECAQCHAKAGAAKDFVFRLRVPPAAR